MQAGILELDLHGMNAYQAKIAIDSTLKKAKGGTYRIRLIHGYRGGSSLMETVRTGVRSKRIARRCVSLNPGVTTYFHKEIKK